VKSRQQHQYDTCTHTFTNTHKYTHKRTQKSTLTQIHTRKRTQKCTHESTLIYSQNGTSKAALAARKSEEGGTLFKIFWHRSKYDGGGVAGYFISSFVVLPLSVEFLFVGTHTARTHTCTHV